jgi:hypothetical protein
MRQTRPPSVPLRARGFPQHHGQFVACHPPLHLSAQLARFGCTHVELRCRGARRALAQHRVARREQGISAKRHNAAAAHGAATAAAAPLGAAAAAAAPPDAHCCCVHATRCTHTDGAPHACCGARRCAVCAGSAHVHQRATDRQPLLADRALLVGCRLQVGLQRQRAEGAVRQQPGDRSARARQGAGACPRAHSRETHAHASSQDKRAQRQLFLLCAVRFAQLAPRTHACMPTHVRSGARATRSSATAPASRPASRLATRCRSRSSSGRGACSALLAAIHCVHGITARHLGPVTMLRGLHYLPVPALCARRFQPANDQSAMAAADPANAQYVYNYAPPAGTLPVTVSYWLSANEDGSLPILNGTIVTDGARDWTVKLDADYSAADASVTTQTVLYYGFSASFNGVAYESPAGSFRAIRSDNDMAKLKCAPRRQRRARARILCRSACAHAFSACAGMRWCRAATGGSVSSTCTICSPRSTTSTSTRTWATSSTSTRRARATHEEQQCNACPAALHATMGAPAAPALLRRPVH